MEGERLTKPANALRGDSRRRGRPILLWEDSVKINFAGEVGKWRMSARDGGETIGRDGNETGSVTEDEGRKFTTVSVPASPGTMNRTTCCMRMYKQCAYAKVGLSSVWQGRTTC